MSLESPAADSQHEELSDEPRQCQDCRAMYLYTADEQRYHRERSWPAPLRCASCRVQRLSKRQRTDRATVVATQLGETMPGAILQIRRLLDVLSTDQINDLVAQTETIEAAGGMWLEREQRRRSKGGVFFTLARDLLTPAERAVVFPPKVWPKRAKQQEQLAAAPEVTAPSTTQRAPGVAEALSTASASQGQAQGVAGVKLTLIGRPGRVIEKQGYVLTSMTGKPAPALPKGLPTPPATLTVYAVYISLKHWKSVAEALQDAEDMLIAEGYPSYDPELEGMAVFVTGVTTKKLQSAKREQQQRQAQGEG